MSDEKDDKNKWEMPKPVFRSTTGALPRSLEETISQSFIANADTIEIDEDDDILSIMDTPYRPEPPKFAEHADVEKTLEIDRDDILEVPTPPETENKPIVVTAKNPDEKAKAVSGDSKSNMVIFFFFVLIAAALAGAYLYNSYQPPVAP